jgi:hypothetical protein
MGNKQSRCKPNKQAFIHGFWLACQNEGFFVWPLKSGPTVAPLLKLALGNKNMKIINPRVWFRTS